MPPALTGGIGTDSNEEFSGISENIFFDSEGRFLAVNVACKQISITLLTRFETPNLALQFFLQFQSFTAGFGTENQYSDGCTNYEQLLEVVPYGCLISPLTFCGQGNTAQ